MYIFYELTFALSLALSILYVLIWNKHYDINISAIFILIPIANIGYLFSSIAINANEATIANKIIYLGGCFLTFFITMSVWNLCNIKVNRYIRFLLFALSTFMYILVLTIGYRDYYYKDFYLDETTGQFVKVYGIGHSFFIALVLAYMIIGVTTIVYTLFKKKQASKTVTILLFIPEFLAFVGYFGNTLFGRKIDVMPLTYVLAQIVYLLIVRRMALYNTSEMVVESMVRTGDTGFINIDFKNHYLGSNETAQNILPGLKELRVDDSIDKVEELRNDLSHWIDHFKQNNELKSNVYIIKDPQNE